MTSTTNILTAAQAQAVYSAMCALNNIGAVIAVDIPDSVDRIRSVRVLGMYAMSVQVEQLWGDHKRELYADKAAFAAAYGLRAAPDAAPLLEALQSLDREGWLSHIEKLARSVGGARIGSEILAHIHSVRAAIAQATA